MKLNNLKNNKQWFIFIITIFMVVTIIGLTLKYSPRSIIKLLDDSIFIGQANIIWYGKDDDKKIDIEYKNYRVSWDIKSGFIENKVLYTLFYYPIYLDKWTEDFKLIDLQNYYKKYYLNKEEVKYEELPFYFIYDWNSNRYAYLNAQKKIISWNLEKNSINFIFVEKLDDSNTVNICDKKCNQYQKLDFNFKTNIDFASAIKWLKNSNTYLNEMMEKY